MNTCPMSVQLEKYEEMIRKGFMGKRKFCRFVVLVTELSIDIAVYYSSRCIYLFIIVLVMYIKNIRSCKITCCG
jgi:hypothetical protein